MKWSDRTILFLLGCLLVFLSGNGSAAGSEILVSAALSLKAPFEDMGRSFERKHPGAKVIFNFNTSGMLQRQIEGGAPSDIFASASPKEMDSLESGGFLIIGTRSNFAGNGIVLIVPSQSRLRIRSFEDLRKKEIRRIAIGNPASVPAGKYAEEVLKTSALWYTLKDKIVLCENVRQVMDYTARNEVNAGMVFRTDAGNSKDIEIISEASEQSHKVIFPLAKKGIIAGAVLSFARAMGEFGATIMLAGNIPGKTDTMPIAIYSLAGSGEWSKAHAMVAVFTIISGVFLYIANRLGKRVL